jgi:hypothetical protein
MATTPFPPDPAALPAPARQTGAARLLRGAILSLVACGLVAADASRALAQDATLSGQVRPRFEYRDPTQTGGAAESYTIGRTRLAAEVRLERDIWGFVQLQDVRIWGEESSTAGDFRADGLDLHQGFLQFGAEDAGRSLRIGRFQQNYGGQRLVGALDWAQQARAFDGARARVRLGDAVTLDGFAFQLSESASIVRELDATFTGAHAVWEVAGGRSLDLFAFWLDEELAAGDNEILTTGLRYVGDEGPWSYRVEGTLQTGERAGRDVQAWMAAVRVGRSLAGGRHTLTAWYDHLSGGAPDDVDDGAFDTLFGTNHKFYGYADLFLNLPVQTDGRGFRDVALKSTWTLAEGWSLQANLHRFLVDEDAGLDDGHLADELDVVLTHPLVPGLTLSGGLSQVWAGDALGPVRGIAENVHFGYLMIDLAF